LRQAGYKVRIELKKDATEEKEMKELEKELNEDADMQVMLAGVNIDAYLDNNDGDDDDDDENEKEKNKPLMIVNDDNQSKIKNIIGIKLLHTIPQSIENLRVIENGFKQKLILLVKDHEGKQTTYDYFNTVMTRLKKTTEKTNKEMDDKPKKKKMIRIMTQILNQNLSQMMKMKNNVVFVWMKSQDMIWV